MTTHVIARRIVLRLDPARLHDGALSRAMRLAKALHAELAARMIADTRLADTFAMAALKAQIPDRRSVESRLHRVELSLREEVSALAKREQTAWSFEVIPCAGILARGCTMAADDVVALELPRIETSLTDLREEIAGALTHARGIILFPAAPRPARGPVATVVENRETATDLIQHGNEIAEALGVPMHVVEHDGDVGPHQAERKEAGDIATAIRRLGASLAVIDAKDAIVDTFLARPRLLRELATPLLLLKV